MPEQAVIVEEWALRLADAVSPDEALLAPTVAEAFIAGGAQRKELFSASGGVLGGFGAGHLAMLMPAVLSAIAAAGPLLVAALSSPATGNVINALEKCVKYISERDKEGEMQAAAAPVPLQPALEPLIAVLDAMQAEMRALGIDAGTSEAAAYRSLRTLVQDPQQATQFVLMVAAAR